jgi:hypothetical protein
VENDKEIFVLHSDDTQMKTDNLTLSQFFSEGPGWTWKGNLK